nr:MAG TPA_asm: hypothetical protein [Caudoviricetes sp.]
MRYPIGILEQNKRFTGYLDRLVWGVCGNIQIHESKTRKLAACGTWPDGVW